MWKEDSTGGVEYSRIWHTMQRDKVTKEIYENHGLFKKSTDAIFKLAEDLEKKSSVQEGYKEREGKVDYSEINLDILDLAAERFTANKHKYPLGNMLKPINKMSLLWASFRHLKKMIKPQNNDPENFKEHLAAVVCNMSMVLDQLEIEDKNKLIDSVTR